MPRSTITAAQSNKRPRNLPRTAHCLARYCCQNPTPSITTERPKSQGRKVAKNVLAAPAPRAAANPNGRQHAMVAKELKIAAKPAEIPEPCFIAHLLYGLRSRRGAPIQPGEGRFVMIPDTSDNLTRRHRFRRVARHPVR